jgi:hypothetical protein
LANYDEIRAFQFLFICFDALILIQLITLNFVAAVWLYLRVLYENVELLIVHALDMHMLHELELSVRFLLFIVNFWFQAPIKLIQLLVPLRLDILKINETIDSDIQNIRELDRTTYLYRQVFGCFRSRDHDVLAWRRLLVF